MRKSTGSLLRRIFVALDSLFSRKKTVPTQSEPEGETTLTTDVFAMMEKFQALFTSDDIEVITYDGRKIRGRIDNLRSTQPFSKPAVKITSASGQITKILFDEIKEVFDHGKR